MNSRLVFGRLVRHALGFSAAGCGLGSLVGLALEPRFFPESPANSTTHEKMMAFYGGTLWGMAIGAALGLTAGVCYALTVRPRRHRDSGGSRPGVASTLE